MRALVSAFGVRGTDSEFLTLPVSSDKVTLDIFTRFDSIVIREVPEPLDTLQYFVIFDSMPDNFIHNTIVFILFCCFELVCCRQIFVV